MTKRIVLITACSILAGGTLVGLRFLATDSYTEARATPDVSTAHTELPSPNDYSFEWSATNFPIPPMSARGDHCPATEVPEGSDIVFGPEDGRIQISFYDSGYQESRTFILDIRDPSCFETRAGRGRIFSELGTYMDTSGDFEAACERLRDAIRAGSLKLGEAPFDMRPAQPYVAEVCRP